MRAHVSLDVRNVPAAVAFYRVLFDQEPQKQTVTYAKFDLTAPALNFSLVASDGAVSAVNHFGIEVESAEAVTAWHRRLQAGGLTSRVQREITCCFARQDKLWVTDPDGNQWEIFYVREQLPLSTPAPDDGCCVRAPGAAAASGACAQSGITVP